MVLTTAIVLPGMGLAEKITVSPSRILIWGCSPLEMRVMADKGSPWEPVVKIKI